MKEMPITSWDERRDFLIPGSKESSIALATEHFVEQANHAIKTKGSFYVALSGGSTPQSIYKSLAEKFKDSVDWTCVHVFWSDERNVPTTHQESNYKTALDSGLKDLPIPSSQIHPMIMDEPLSEQAKQYENLVKEIDFDMIMLGMGSDGHIASLFPDTEGLYEKNRLVVANYIPQKKCWRMSFTLPMIHKSKSIVLYVMGPDKQEAILDVFKNTDSILPAFKVGQNTNKALWIMDEEASYLLTQIG
ncbi:MAG: 6-phosphogluconolactonase [Rhabdochlamydiaceae bacterium]